MQSIDRDSREYVGAAVTATFQGQPYNPTADTVAFAFTTGSARPATWYTGAWDSTNPTAGTNTYRAQVLVGPGSSGPVLDPGAYTIWVKITDNPEQPIINVGPLAVT